MLIAFRVLAGIGLGGATPCFIALTSEYAPARLRAALVTLMWSAFPLGAMTGRPVELVSDSRSWAGARFSISAASHRLFLPSCCSFICRVDQISSRPQQRRKSRRRASLRAFRSPLVPRRRAFCRRREAFARRVDPASVHRRPHARHAVVMGAVLHGFRRAHGRGIVDAGIVAAQRHFAGQHRLRRRFQRIGRLYRPINCRAA